MVYRNKCVRISRILHTR